MKYQLVIASEAQNQRDSELTYYSDRSAKYAERWYAAYLATLRVLRTTPDRYPRAREADEVLVDLREAYFGVKPRRPTHRLLYVIVGEEVRIVTLRHHAQADWRY